MVVAYLQKDVRFFADLVPVSKICETEKKIKPSPKTRRKPKPIKTKVKVMSFRSQPGRNAQIPKNFALSCLTHHFFRVVMEHRYWKEKQVNCRTRSEPASATF